MLRTYNKQYYGIKFPFTANNLERFFLDLNERLSDKVVSQIAHVILTPKGQRLRMPEFGTNLLRYIFNPSDELEWSDVKDEIKASVGMYVKDAELTDIEVVTDTNDDNAIYIAISYTVMEGNKTVNKMANFKI